MLENVSFAYSSFLGYKKEDDKLVIDEDEAVIVKKIYRMFLVEGKTASGIANYLKSHHIKTPSGKSANWTKNNINSILTNEKYKGDALLQKSYTENYLEQTMVKNTGQIPQYYVENNHPAIIDKEMWEEVQIELERRNKIGANYSSSDTFSSKLICKDCGGFYGKKKWHSNSKYSRFIYQCNNKFSKHKEKCLTPHLTEEDIKYKFIQAYNVTMKDKKRIIKDTKDIIELLTNTNSLEDDILRTDDELVITSELVNKLVRENSKTNLSLDDYNKRYNELFSRYEKLKLKREGLLKQRDDKLVQAYKTKAFIKSLSNLEDQLDGWNTSIWMLLVDNATVHRDSSITFRFYNGNEITK